MANNLPSHRLLFVCTGNLCRSPMAEVLAEDHGTRSGLELEARSAGTLGLVDRPADPKAVAVCLELGLDLADHRSQPVTPELVSWADTILVMEFAHAAILRERFPDLGERLLLLGSFGGLLEVPDPLGGWKFQFRRCRDQIRQCVEGYLDQHLRTLARPHPERAER